jgi:hypothetical protein
VGREEFQVHMRIQCVCHFLADHDGMASSVVKLMCFIIG